MTWLKIKREVLLEWPISNDRSVFSENQLMKVRGICKTT